MAKICNLIYLPIMNSTFLEGPKFKLAAHELLGCSAKQNK